ncbi:acetolactate synthase [Bradyrhizobium sp. Y36]|uniref:thiamine pyrophosphate-binding protein n=1 Tax=Bradyrhizobium sp. Y36 TaxID=2035447 RepID=UPI000BE988BF|nr:thiamine pyrophosphate-binding protein [Bradyrhizobium sp. Y36]PDT82267.1 acetolactate synthase [Bradyrhizobium sp. Y36]
MAHVGDLLAEMLQQLEVEFVFGMPGGQTAALHDGIARRTPAIRHILVRDERSAGYAADAYARLTGKPGVCDVTVGPGATKLPDGLVEALNASIPMVAIVGELPLAWTSLRAKGVASQGFDQAAFFQPITKATFMVPSVAALPDLVRSAFRIATAPRPGPVVLIIPHDVMDAEWDEAAIKPTIDSRSIRAPSLRYAPPASDIIHAARLIESAKRPAIIAGGGVHGSDAAELLTRITDRIQPLVVTSLSGKGTVPETRNYAAGVLNPLGSAAAIDLIKEADLVIWCGSKASQNTAMNWTLPLPGQVTITIDSDPLEHGRTFRPTVPLCGDVRLTLEMLDAQLSAEPQAEWLARIAKVKAQHDAATSEDASSTSVPIHPARVMRALAERLGPKDVVISDASWSAGWIGVHVPAVKPGRHFLYARGQGGLGYSIPAAIGAGALLGKNGGHVVTVAGDGGHSFAIGELATQAQNRMKIVNVVLNNGTLGWLQMWEEFYFSNLRQSVDLSFDGGPNYAAAAEALGLKGIRVKTPDQIEKAMDEAFAHDGPVVLEVIIDPRATPIHSFRRRLRHSGKALPRPGTVYELREWKKSPDGVSG